MTAPGGKETGANTEMLRQGNIQERLVFVVNRSGVNTQSAPAEQTEQVITDRAEQVLWSQGRCTIEPTSSERLLLLSFA